MKKELVIKKCSKCGALVKIINYCNCDDCGIKCCNEKMITVKSNSVDAAVEKHVPAYELNDNDVVVTVNHVMDEDHYIEWIALVTDEKEEVYYLKPGVSATVTFKDVKEGKLYSYCNKHGLWENEIK